VEGKSFFVPLEIDLFRWKYLQSWCWHKQRAVYDGPISTKSYLSLSRPQSLGLFILPFPLLRSADREIDGILPQMFSKIWPARSGTGGCPNIGSCISDSLCLLCVVPLPEVFKELSQTVYIWFLCSSVFFYSLLVLPISQPFVTPVAHSHSLSVSPGIWSTPASSCASEVYSDLEVCMLLVNVPHVVLYLACFFASSRSFFFFSGLERSGSNCEEFRQWAVTFIAHSWLYIPSSL